MQTIKQILHILKGKGFDSKKETFIDKKIVIGFDTDKAPLTLENLSEDQLNYPVTKLYIRIGNMPFPINDSRITAAMRREGTVDPDLILSQNPLLNITLKDLKKKVYYGAENYSSAKFKDYVLGEYCLNKGVLYRLVKQIPWNDGDTSRKFDPYYWEKVKQKDCRFIFMVVNLPENFLKSDLYLKKFLHPYIFNSLMDNHNTVMHEDTYNSAVEYFGGKDKLEKALCDLTGYDLHIMQSTVENCYIIYDKRTVGRRKETEA